jgi:hypothetical protein
MLEVRISAVFVVVVWIKVAFAGLTLLLGIVFELNLVNILASLARSKITSEGKSGLTSSKLQIYDLYCSIFLCMHFV